MNRWQQLCVAGAIGLVSVSVSAIDTPPSWNPPEVVAAVPGYFFLFDGYEGQNRYMQFDHFGEVGIAYSNSETFYARRTPGLGWQSANVNGFSANDELGQPSLAFNLSEQPAVAFVEDNAGLADEIRWTRLEDATWVDETAIATTPITLEELGASGIFDFTGRAMLAAVTRDATYFKHDTDGDGSLFAETLEEVYSGAPIGRASCSLVVDPINRPMIAAAHGNGASLRFAVRDTGTGWQWIELDTNADYPSLAIDPDTGYPAVAYTDLASANLVYGEWNGTKWVFTNVDTAPSTGWYPSLAFDPADGNPAIAYQDQGSGDLKLAWHDGAQWNLQTVVNGTIKVPIGWTPSLAFNAFGNGFPAIAYFGIDSNLYYIEDPPPAADLDGDGYVGIADFLLLLNAWGDCVSCPPSCAGDLDGDCTVGITDFLLLLAAWT